MPPERRPDRFAADPEAEFADYLPAEPDGLCPRCSHAQHSAECFCGCRGIGAKHRRPVTARKGRLWGWLYRLVTPSEW